LSAISVRAATTCCSISGVAALAAPSFAADATAGFAPSGGAPSGFELAAWDARDVGVRGRCGVLAAALFEREGGRDVGIVGSAGACWARGVGTAAAPLVGVPMRAGVLGRTGDERPDVGGRSIFGGMVLPWQQIHESVDSVHRMRAGRRQSEAGWR
jgi:hypothetical protein